MIRRTLVLASFIGGIACAVAQINRKAAQKRTQLNALEKEAKSRWENEGGASAPIAT